MQQGWRGSASVIAIAKWRRLLSCGIWGPFISLLESDDDGDSELYTGLTAKAKIRPLQNYVK